MSAFTLDTPWGRADSATDLGLGIMSVSTPSHGGIFVPEEQLPNIPAHARAWARKWTRSEQWYEEDCCWSAVAVTFPVLFTTEELHVARRIFSQYCPPVGGVGA
jgi:hypothetical protein